MLFNHNKKKIKRQYENIYFRKSTEQHWFCNNTRINESYNMLTQDSFLYYSFFFVSSLLDAYKIVNKCEISCYGFNWSLCVY